MCVTTMRVLLVHLSEPESCALFASWWLLARAFAVHVAFRLPVDSLLSTPSDTRNVPPRQGASFQDHGQFRKGVREIDSPGVGPGAEGRPEDTTGLGRLQVGDGLAGHLDSQHPPRLCPRISVEPRSPEPRKGPRQSPGNAIWLTPLRGVKLGSSSKGFASCVVQESEGSSGCRGEKLR